MRKWMRDKLKGRKKSKEDAATKPAPLQPAYFGTEREIAPPEAPVSEPSPEPSPEPAESEAIGAAEAAESSPVDTISQPSLQTADNARRPRRRRGRGGRGRRRPGQTQPAAPMTATAPASDMVRSLLFDDPAEQRFQDLVFSNLRSMLKARLIARRPMNYVDATNLTPQERHNWIKLAKDFGYEVHAVFFDVPLEVCIERHHRRDRLVPEDVMRKMAAKLKAPTFDEGFARITVVRVKQKAE